MIGAGTIISPIIKIVTTVAILAAIYFFFVKPTLDTVENTTRGAFESFDLPDNVSPGVKETVREAQKLQRQASKASSAQIADATKLLECINDASGDVEKISACNAKFSP